mgnify:CR=1 FL=1
MSQSDSQTNIRTEWIEITAEDDGGGAWTLDEFLHRTYTDAFLIAHRGKVVHRGKLWHLLRCL